MNKSQQKKFDEMKIYSFEENQGVGIVEGESFYPAMIRVRLSRLSLWNLVKQILRRLQNGNHMDEEYLFFGKLTDVTEEERE